MVAFTLNERDVSVDVPDDSPLLFVLANDLQVNGAKYGCGRSQCGTCVVLIDGEPVRSCTTKVSAAAGRWVTTLEGLLADGKPSKLQQAVRNKNRSMVFLMLISFLSFYGAKRMVA